MFLLFICSCVGVTDILQIYYNIRFLFYYFYDGEDFLNQKLFDLITLEQFYTAFNICNIVFCLINIFLTMVIQIHTMIFLNLSSIFLGLSIVLIGKKLIATAVLAILLIWFGFSSLFPILLALVEERTRICSRKISFIFFSKLLISEYLFVNFYGIFRDLKYFIFGLCLVGGLIIFYSILVFYLERKRLTDESLKVYVKNRLFKKSQRASLSNAHSTAESENEA